MEYCGCWFTSQLHEVMLPTRLFTPLRMRSQIPPKRSMGWTLSIILEKQYVTVLHSFSLICTDNNNQTKWTCMCSNEQSWTQENNLPFRAVGRAVWWFHGRVKMAGSLSGSCSRGLPEKWRCHIRNAAYISTRALLLRGRITQHTVMLQSSLTTSLWPSLARARSSDFGMTWAVPRSEQNIQLLDVSFTMHIWKNF